MMKEIINKEKCEKFLSSLDDNTRKHATKIIDNTVFISTVRMIEMVKNAFSKCKDDHPQYNLYIPEGKIGSDHYILLELKDILNPVQIMYNKNTIIQNDFPIVILDDAVYSSCHVCEIIDTMRFDYKLKNKIFIIVAILSSSKVQVLTDPYFNPVEIFYDTCLEHLLIKNLFQEEKMDTFGCSSIFKCETPLVLPLIFEHKIANAFGSYQFYHKIVDKPISRKVIDQVTRKDIEDLINILTCK